jgi:inosose dehydratase
MRMMRVAHQAMTWFGWWEKKKMPVNVERLLEEVREAGYEGVELGGSAATLGPPRHLKDLLAVNELELAAWAVGVTAAPWPSNTDEYRRDIDYAAQMEVKTIMVCGGFLGEGGRRTTFDEDYQVFAENLNAAADYAKQYGQTIAYHPHRGCIVETGEEVDRLLKFKPRVALCPDTGHLAAVRSDPAALIRRYPAKIQLMHMKDFDAKTRNFTELGQGSAGLDFKAIRDALREIRYNGWLVVERDDPPIPAIESAKISRRFLRLLGL